MAWFIRTFALLRWSISNNLLLSLCDLDVLLSGGGYKHISFLSNGLRDLAAALHTLALLGFKIWGHFDGYVVEKVWLVI